MSMFSSSSDAGFLAALGTQQPSVAEVPPAAPKARTPIPALPLSTVPPPPEEPKTPPPGSAPPPLPPPLVAPSPAKTLSLVAAIGADPVFSVGDRVAVPQHGEGTVRFYGQVHFQPGVWVGVELDAPQGKNDGSVQGQRYFQCKPQHGIFIRPSRLTLTNGEPTTPGRYAHDSSSVPASPGIWESPGPKPGSPLPSVSRSLSPASVTATPPAVTAPPQPQQAPPLLNASMTNGHSVAAKQETSGELTPAPVPAVAPQVVPTALVPHARIGAATSAAPVAPAVATPPPAPPSRPSSPSPTPSPTPSPAIAAPPVANAAPEAASTESPQVPPAVQHIPELSPPIAPVRDAATPAPSSTEESAKATVPEPLADHGAGEHIPVPEIVPYSSAIPSPPFSPPREAQPASQPLFVSPMATEGSSLFGAAASFDWNTYTAIPPPPSEGGIPPLAADASDSVAGGSIAEPADHNPWDTAAIAAPDPWASFLSPPQQDEAPPRDEDGPAEEINLNDDAKPTAPTATPEDITPQAAPEVAQLSASHSSNADSAPASPTVSRAPSAQQPLAAADVVPQSPAPAAAHDMFAGRGGSASSDPFAALFGGPARPVAPAVSHTPTASAALASLTFGDGGALAARSTNSPPVMQDVSSGVLGSVTQEAPKAGGAAVEAAPASLFGGSSKADVFFAALSRPSHSAPSLSSVPTSQAHAPPSAFSGFGPSHTTAHNNLFPSPIFSTPSPVAVPKGAAAPDRNSSFNDFDSISLDSPAHSPAVPVPAPATKSYVPSVFTPAPITAPPSFSPPSRTSIPPIAAPAFPTPAVPQAFPAPSAPTSLPQPSILTPSAPSTDLWHTHSTPTLSGSAPAPQRKIEVFNPSIVAPPPMPTPLPVPTPTPAHTRVTASPPVARNPPSVFNPSILPAPSLPSVTPPTPAPPSAPSTATAYAPAPAPPASLRAESLSWSSGASRAQPTSEPAAPQRPAIEVFDPTKPRTRAGLSASLPAPHAPPPVPTPPTFISHPPAPPTSLTMSGDDFVAAAPPHSAYVPAPPRAQLSSSLPAPYVPHPASAASFEHSFMPAPAASFSVFDPTQSSGHAVDSSYFPALPTSNIPSPPTPIRHRPPSEAGIRPHPVVAFGFGGKFAIIFPSGSGNASGFYQGGASVQTPIRVASLRNVLEGTKYLASLTSYPGPLTSSSSKDAVLRFVNERAAAAAAEGVGPVPEARRLLWDVLRVALKHYGNLGPAREEGETPAAKSLLELLLAKDKDASFIGGGDELLMSAPPPPSHHAEGAVLTQIQQLLMTGKTREAWRAAFEAGLWSHALLLSRSVDEAAVQATVAAFAASSLPDGSPLRSFYLVLANSMQELARPSEHSRSPQQRAALLDRWQENLAILLANRSRDGAVLGRLGDVLWSRYGCVEAAHICYLAADHAFQSAENPNARLVLLGGDHKIRRRNLFTVESLQRTEIIEFSRRLANSQYNLATLAPYKLLYAMQLADLGLLEQAHHYLQILHPLVADKKSAANYPPVFVQQVNLFAHRMSHLSAGLSSGLTKGGRWNPLSTLGSLVGRGLYAIIGDGEAEEEATSGHPAAMSGVIPPPSVHAAMEPPMHAKPVTRPSQPPRAAEPSKPKPAPTPALAPKPAEKPKKEDPKGKKPVAKSSGDDEVSAPGGGWLSGWFGRPKPKNPVHLGKKMDDIVYDKELQMYVKKGTREPAFASAAARVAAPPTDAQLNAGAHTPLPSAPPSMGPPSLGPPSLTPHAAPALNGAPAPAAAGIATPPGPQPDGGAAGSRFSRFGGAKPRARYYDPLNPTADAAPAAPTPAMLAPALAPKLALLTPAAPALFTPTVSEAPSTYESPDFYAPPPPPTYEEPAAAEPAVLEPTLASQEPPAVDNSWLDT